MNFKERYQYNPASDLLGRGGFARVYKAHDKLLNRTVALKFFVKETDDKHTLIQEISRAIQLEHPNLCRYYDAAVVENTNIHGETETIEVGVMEYLDGSDIKTFLKQNPEQRDKLLTDVLQGLSFLHENGIIHRDLKAQNILIKNATKGPVAKITDFGISKVTGADTSSSSALLGTIEYMAPEQFHPEKFGINGKISTNMDFWSFGLLVYDLLINESLFGTGRNEISTARVMGKILEEDNTTKIEKLSEPYRTVVKKCLIKDANYRVQNAQELITVFSNSKLLSSDISKLETNIKINSDYKTTLINTKKTGVSKGTVDDPDNIENNSYPWEADDSENKKKKKRKYILIASLTALLFLILGLKLFTKEKDTLSYNNSFENSNQAVSKTDSIKASTNDKLVLPLEEGVKEEALVEEVFQNVEVEASFPGGEIQWRRYLEKNLNGNVPVDNGALAGVYTVIIKFIVEKDGQISNVKSLTDKGFGMENEAIRLVKNSPPWKPAIQNGRQVRAYRIQPISFQVTEE